MISLADRGHLPGARTAVDRKKLALVAGMRLDRRWRAGALLVNLYSAAGQ